MKRDSQVILKLEGGLGNQLFQLAAGYFLAAKIHSDLLIDQYSIPLTTVHGEKTHGFREFNIQILQNNAKIHILEKVPNTVQIWLAKRSMIVKRLLLKARLMALNSNERGVFTENNELSSKMDFLGINNPVKLHGNFQSWEIVQRATELGFPQILKLAIVPNWIVKSDIDFKHSIVLHLRLGDDTRLNQDFKQPNIEYYLAAARQLVSIMNTPKIYVLSDDLQRAESFLGKSFLNKVEYLEMPSESSPAERMYFMSLFGGLVCANSTFCGWAAWSIYNSGGNVVVPVPYSDGPVLGSRDFPPEWIQLNKYSGESVG